MRPGPPPLIPRRAAVQASKASFLGAAGAPTHVIGEPTRLRWPRHARVHHEATKAAPRDVQDAERFGKEVLKATAKDDASAPYDVRAEESAAHNAQHAKRCVVQ